MFQEQREALEQIIEVLEEIQRTFPDQAQDISVGIHGLKDIWEQLGLQEAASKAIEQARIEGRQD